MGRRSPAAVRRASAADAAAAARLLHDFNSEFDAPTPGVAVLTERLEEILAQEEATILLVGEGPHGLVQLRYRRAIFSVGLDAYLEELYVVPERRGEGLGRALLEAAMEAARAAGASRIELGTSEADTAAQALYESAGFSNREGGPEGPLMYFYERDL
jgi:ribosomal protein S18 acetylase RimI-like enzyme